MAEILDPINDGDLKAENLVGSRDVHAVAMMIVQAVPVARLGDGFVANGSDR